MSFDTLPFLVFFSGFFVAYHALFRSRTLQNVLILCGSYLFYGWWNPRLLSLIVICSGVNYACALGIGSARTRRGAGLWMAAAAVVSLGILAVFKYADFFLGSLAAAAAAAGVDLHAPALRIILPVGISFYTFQAVGYTVDVYRGDIPAERNALAFFSFVAFFPQLVAGPIERAGRLLPQFHRARTVEDPDVREAVWLLCWGYFLKVFIANQAGAFVDLAFDTGQTNGWLTILGSLGITLQIYCDFQAYSLIARGTALLLGFHLMWNFDRPYSSTSLREFWRRWHISLSTWFRDYVFIPLGGSRRGPALTYVNLMATMVLCGLWHGAAWPFVLWGFLHGAGLCLERAARIAGGGRHRLPAPVAWAATMAFVCVGWFLIRCDDWAMVAGMVGALRHMAWTPVCTDMARTLALLTLPLALVEIMDYRAGAQPAALRLGRLPFGLACGGLAAAVIILFGRFNYAFIYFQF